MRVVKEKTHRTKRMKKNMIKGKMDFQQKLFRVEDHKRKMC